MLQNMKYSDLEVVFDEIDKFDSKSCDLVSALLEVLDPTQNKCFVDRYLEVPYDLSRVIFFVIANHLSAIPRPLLDRLEIIGIDGYYAQEKLKIAKNILIPTNKKEHGLKRNSVIFTDEALIKIIENYIHEWSK